MTTKKENLISVAMLSIVATVVVAAAAVDVAAVREGTERAIRSRSLLRRISHSRLLQLGEGGVVVEAAQFGCCEDQKGSDFAGRLRCKGDNGCCIAMCSEVLLCCEDVEVGDYIGRERCNLPDKSCCRACATLAPTQSFPPSALPSHTPSELPSAHPSVQPSAAPSSRPSEMPSIHPSVQPSDVPTSRSQESPEEICPRNRRYPPEKFTVAPYTDTTPGDGVQDDLNEVSYIAYSSQTDSNGHRYAYMASDKEQFSLKVVQFAHNIFDSGNYFHGHGTTVATYTLFTPENKPTNDDWEDISLGPCTDMDTAHYTTDQVCIYIGNVGNNLRSPKPQRKELYIYKFVEPFIRSSGGPQDQTVPFATIGYRYGSGFDQAVDKYYDGTIFHGFLGLLLVAACLLIGSRSSLQCFVVFASRELVCRLGWRGLQCR